MKKILSLLIHPVVLYLLGLLAFALLVLLVGPLVSIGSWRPLGSSTAQWVLIGIAVALVLLINLVGWLRARAKNRAVVAQLGGAADAKGGAESSELKQLRERFDQALNQLRDVRLGSAGRGGWASFFDRRRYLYELPWYAIVGAPGSGKTTALLNSGLRFPLSGRMGGGSVKGVGGTRNCDWWFSEQAVLLDTAGRYTTHDSDPEADKAAWSGFLDLLRRTRPRRPLNGVLVTVSIADLLSFSAEQRALYGQVLRQRIDELQQRLGLRLPTYLLVTKCDLLAGFMDYFANGDQIDRAQPWGFTFPPQLSEQGKANSRFEAEFDRLTQRLMDGVIDRVQAERDRARRTRVYGFPLQFGALRSALGEIVESLGAPSNLGVTPLLRGVYFISGTQEGAPFDRLLGAVARQLRLDGAVLPPHRGSGRSFFITRVLSDVVFAEAEYAGANVAWERRRRKILWAAYSGVALAALLLGFGWTISYLNNRADIRDFAAKADELGKLIEATPNQVGTELPPILPALNAAGELAKPASVPWSHALGLSQDAKLRGAATLAYRHLLADGMLPRIRLRFEELLQTSDANPELAYETLKAYVMLHSPENYDAKALQEFVGLDWNADVARGTLTQDQRTALDEHKRALFEMPIASQPIGQDAALVAHVRDRLKAQTLALRIYRRLRILGGLGEDIPEFTILKYGGSQAPFVFQRASGKPLNQGVPGLYTYDGYYKRFQKAVDEATLQLAGEEPWVLATGGSGLANRLQTLDTAAEVRRIYLHDYIQQWDEFIGDIRVVKTRSLDETIEQARVLSQPQNPLKPLMRAIVRETTLTAAPESQSLVERVEAKAQGVLQETGKLSEMLGGTARAPAKPVERPEQIVDDHFAALREMVLGAGGGAPSQLDGTIGTLNEVYMQLNAAKTATDSGMPPPASDLPSKLRAEAGRLPEPLRSIVTSISSSSQNGALSAERENISKRLNADIGKACREGVEGRYPFNRYSERDVPPDTFASLFAPGGMFDDFFAKNLKTYVDESSQPWSFRQVGDARMGVDSGSLQQFQRAAAIRDVFFHGGREFSVKLDFTPYDMDPSITQFTLDVDGQKVQWGFGPKLHTPVNWPGPQGRNQVRLTLAPATSASETETSGPWALFRMFDRMQVERLNSPEKFRVTFAIEGRRAIFDVTVHGSHNPFAMPELRDFHCPSGL